jgi:iron complex outermembrane receptor protein
LQKIGYIFLLFLGYHCFAQPDTLKSFELIDKRNTSVETDIVIENPREVNSSSNLTEVLSQSLPVFIRNYGPGGIATLQLGGGTPQQTQLLWNGMKINYPSLGLSDPNIVPNGMVGGIDVSLGLNSQMHGSGGLGGSINLRPKRIERTGFDIELLGGSFGERAINASASLVRNKNALQIGGGTYHAMNNFPFLNIAQIDRQIEFQEHANVNRSYGFIQYKFYRNDKSIWGINGFISHNYRQVPPSLLSPSKASLEDLMGLIQLSYQRNFTKWKSESFLGYYGQVQNYEDSASEIFSETKSQNLQFKSTWERQFLKDRLSWRSSVDAMAQELHVEAYDKKRINFQSSLSSYLAYQWNPIHRSYLTLRKEYNLQSFGPTTPTLGHEFLLKNERYKPAIGLSLGKNYRFPTFNDLYWRPGGNEELEPESSSSASMYIRFLPFKKFSWFNEAYYNLTENGIRWLPTNGVWQAENVELQKQLGFRSRIETAFDISKLTFIIRSGFEGLMSEIKQTSNEWKEAPFIPNYNFQAAIKVNYKSWSFLYQNQMNSRYYANFENSIFMPAVDLHSAYISYKIKSLMKSGKLSKTGLQFKFRVRNIFDKMYQSTPYFPMPGRSYQFSLILKHE